MPINEIKTAGFIGKVLGKNVGKVKGEMNALKSQMAHTKETMGNAKGIFGNKKFSDSTTRRAMKGDYEKLKEMKGRLGKEQRATFGARAKAVVGAGAIGGAAYSGNKLMQNRNEGNNDEFKPQYLASHKDELIEKISSTIIKEASIGGKAKSILKSVKGVAVGVRDTANLSRFREASKDYNALMSGKVNGDTSKSVKDLIQLRGKIQKLQNRNKKLSALAEKYYGGPKDFVKTYPGQPFKVTRQERINEALNNANRVGKGSTKDRLNDIKQRNMKANKYSDLAKDNEKILGAAGAKYQAGAKDIQDMNDIEFSKAVGLYGGLAGLTGYGIHKAVKSKKAKA